MLLGLDGHRHGAPSRSFIDGMQVAIGGGVESISLVQNDKVNKFRAADPWLVKNMSRRSI